MSGFVNVSHREKPASDFWAIRKSPQRASVLTGKRITEADRPLAISILEIGESKPEKAEVTTRPFLLSFVFPDIGRNPAKGLPLCEALESVIYARVTITSHRKLGG